MTDQRPSPSRTLAAVHLSGDLWEAELISDRVAGDFDAGNFKIAQHSSSSMGAIESKQYCKTDMVNFETSQKRSMLKAATYGGSLSSCRQRQKRKFEVSVDYIVESLPRKHDQTFFSRSTDKNL